jgi:O-methyltransferase
MGAIKKTDYDQLIDDLKSALANNVNSKFAIVGHTPLAYDVIGFFRSVGAENRVLGIYCEEFDRKSATVLHRSITQLGPDAPDVIVIASDSEKERLLELAARHVLPGARVVLVGYAHFEFRDKVFDEVVRSVAIPSLANGYPNSLIHLYQCLQNAARLGVNGIVVEFGIFKGGTTLLLSRFVERLGQSWPVVGFDTFAGFPPKRSVLDMYEHPDCVFREESLVRQYLAGRNIEIVSGDVVTTVEQLRNAEIVVAFVDTDNFTPASEIGRASCRERV